MQIFIGDIWDFDGPILNWIVIPTNTQIKNDGDAIMGRGLALEANTKYSILATNYGYFLSHSVNKTVPYFCSITNLILFPIKIHWHDDSDMDLIITNCKMMADRILELHLSGKESHVYLPALGCGNGKLSWNDVAAAIRPILSDRFTVVLE